MAEAAFGRLFGTGGSLVPALTILLTLYVALFAFALLTGRSRIGISSLTPRMVTLGLVLTFATSWVAYQRRVWNLAIGAPERDRRDAHRHAGQRNDVFAQKIDMVFQALIEASGTARRTRPSRRPACCGSAVRCSCSARSACWSPPGSRWRCCWRSGRCSWCWRCSPARAGCSPAG